LCLVAFVVLFWYFETQEHVNPNSVNSSTGITDGNQKTFIATTSLISQTSIATLATETTAKVESNPKPKEEWLNPRIPNHFRPLHYKVDLKPDLTPDSSGFYWFFGSSEVTFLVTKNTSTIVIHSNKLKYFNVDLMDEKVKIK